QRVNSGRHRNSKGTRLFRRRRMRRPQCLNKRLGSMLCPRHCGMQSAGYYLGCRLPRRPRAASMEVVTTTLDHLPFIEELVEVGEVSAVWKCGDDLERDRLDIRHRC